MIFTIICLVVAVGALALYFYRKNKMKNLANSEQDYDDDDESYGEEE